MASANRPVFDGLLRSLKTLRLNAHARHRFEDYVHVCFQRLEEELERSTTWRLKIEPFHVYANSELVWEKDSQVDEDSLGVGRESLFYQLWKDGIRTITFRRGLTIDELVSFLVLCSERTNLEDRQDLGWLNEDLVTQLWKLDLAHVEYEAVDAVAFADLDEDFVHEAVEKLLRVLHDRLASDTEDPARFASLSPEDFEVRLPMVEQLRCGVVAGRSVRPEEQQLAQATLKDEAERTLLPKLYGILFNVLRLSATEVSWPGFRALLRQLLTALEANRDFPAIVQLVYRFQHTEELAGETNSSLIEKTREYLRDAMMEPSRLEALSDWVNHCTPFPKLSFETYLSMATQGDADNLLEMLCEQKNQAPRDVLQERLVELFENGEDGMALARLVRTKGILRSRSSSAAHAVGNVLLRLKPPTLLDDLAEGLDNPNPAARERALAHLARVRQPRAFGLMERALRIETEPRQRFKVYRSLLVGFPLKATETFIRILSTEKLEPIEEIQLFKAIGRAAQANGNTRAIGFLRAALAPPETLADRLLGGDQRRKLAAIEGMKAWGTRSAFRILKEVKSRGVRERRPVVLAAHEALVLLKERLEGAAA